MNKKYLMILLTLAIIIPLNVYASDDIYTSTISASCKCIHDSSGNLNCDNNNCSVETIKSKLEDKCGSEGTIGDISYTCTSDSVGTVSGSSPSDACKTSSTNEGHMKVVGKTTCTSKIVHVGENFCSDISSTARFIGYIWFCLKILIPFMIILMGSFDLFKAVTSDKDEDLKKQTILFGKRVLVGVIFFFIPTILDVAMSFVSGWSDNVASYNECTTCLFHPWECDENKDN